jgi:hypothetical protein
LEKGLGDDSRFGKILISEKNTLEEIHMNTNGRRKNVRVSLWTGAAFFILLVTMNFAQAAPKKGSEVANLGSAAGAVTGAKPFTAA